VLTGKGLIAWTRILAELTLALATPTPAPAPAPPGTLTRELVNILAALALAPT